MAFLFSYQGSMKYGVGFTFFSNQSERTSIEGSISHNGFYSGSISAAV